MVGRVRVLGGFAAFGAFWGAWGATLPAIAVARRRRRRAARHRAVVHRRGRAGLDALGRDARRSLGRPCAAGGPGPLRSRGAAAGPRDLRRRPRRRAAGARRRLGRGRRRHQRRGRPQRGRDGPPGDEPRPRHVLGVRRRGQPGGGWPARGGRGGPRRPSPLSAPSPGGHRGRAAARPPAAGGALACPPAPRCATCPPALLAALGGLCALAFFVENAWQSWGAVHLESDLDASPAVGALAPALFAGAAAVSRLGGHGLAGRVRELTLLRGRRPLGAAGTLLGALAPAPALALVGWGWRAGASRSARRPLLDRRPRRRRGRAGRRVSVVTTIAYLGSSWARRRWACWPAPRPWRRAWPRFPPWRWRWRSWRARALRQTVRIERQATARPLLRRPRSGRRGSPR